MSKDWILLGPASSDLIFMSYISKMYQEVVPGDLKVYFYLWMHAAMVSVICSAISYLSFAMYQVLFQAPLILICKSLIGTFWERGAVTTSICDEETKYWEVKWLPQGHTAAGSTSFHGIPSELSGYISGSSLRMTVWTGHPQPQASPFSAAHCKCPPLVPVSGEKCAQCEEKWEIFAASTCGLLLNKSFQRLQAEPAAQDLFAQDLQELVLQGWGTGQMEQAGGRGAAGLISILAIKC